MTRTLSSQAFKEAAVELADHPFVVRASNGELTDREWSIYVDQRTEAGDKFTDFIERAIWVAKDAGGQGIQLALQENLNEENGIFDNREHPHAVHSLWRQNFRSGIFAILERVQVTDANAHYHAVLESLLQSRDVYKVGGAFAGLELIIGYEYKKVLQGLEKRFPSLTSQQTLYIRSHALHEDRHFQEMLAPLIVACDTKQKVSSALEGLDIIHAAKRRQIDEIASTASDEN